MLEDCKIEEQELPSAMDVLGTQIRGLVKVRRIFFPKKSGRDITPGEFGILSVVLEAVEEGCVPKELSSFGNNSINAVLTIKGSIPQIDFDTSYYFVGTLTNDKKFGLQYSIDMLHKMFSFTTPEQKRMFLNTIIGESKTNILFENFEDPIAPLAAGDTNSLVAIKGIGEDSATKLIEKYKNNIGNSGALVSLQEYGLTPNAISKLQLHFKSADTALWVIQKNPYSLIDLIEGVGWEKADAIALNGGFDPCGENRLKGYVKFLLTSQANVEGHSWVELDFLVDCIKSITHNNIQDETLRGMLKGWLEGSPPLLYYEPETRKIGLYYYRKLEEKIAAEIKRLIDATNFKTLSQETIDNSIKESEQIIGFEFTEEQKRAISSTIHNPVSIVTGSAGCVDSDTEFFNGIEWKRIGEYTEGEKVLQYDIDTEEATLTYPLEYIKKPSKTLWSFETRGTNQTLSLNHRCVYKTRKGVVKQETFETIKNKHEQTKGFGGLFPTSFNYSGKGIDLTNEEIRLMVATMADGSFCKNVENSPQAKSHYTCRFHLKKDRKKERLRELFTQANVEWRESPSAAQGYTDIYYQAPRREKEFTPFWYDCTNEQLQVICDELQYWDGNINYTKTGKKRIRFSSNNKTTIDFVQFAYSACGMHCSISKNDRVGEVHQVGEKQYTRKTIEYSCSISKNSWLGMTQESLVGQKTQIKEVGTKDGYEYCFRVSTGALVLRKDNKIFATFNCGKSTIMHPVCNLLVREKQSFAQTSLSGKAASNLSEITGRKGQTIHRLLGFNPDAGGFSKGKENPLSFNTIILDEVSLVGGEIFLSLLEAIPSGSRLILLGDPNQLPAIGLSNLICDLLDSNAVAASRLMKIHRQAAQSGIITESLRVSAKEQIVPQLPCDEIRGELKDLKIKTYTDAGLSNQYLLEEYKRLYIEKGISPNDIMVVVPNRNRGGFGCFSLNNQIQQIVNSELKDEVNLRSVDGEYKIKVGDKILIGKNCYDTVDAMGEVTPIFNGNTGFVEAIYEDEIVVDLVQQGRVIVPKVYWNIIELGYTMTCHRCQGSSSPYVIVGLDMAAYVLLSKEWVYTAMTRAKKHCTLLAQVSAMRRASSTSKVVIKQTWLRDTLRDFTIQMDAGCSEPLWKYKYREPVLKEAEEMKWLSEKEI